MDKAKFKLAAYEQGLIRNLKAGNVERSIFYGVKYLGEMPYIFNPLTVEDTFYHFSSILEIMKLITPNTLMNIFPVSKNFEHDPDFKDYFTTMEAINKHGRYSLIEEPFDFLWDYMNWDTERFVIRFMGVLNDFNQIHGNKDMLEDFFGLHPFEG
jgi:hypothetical protein